MASIADALNDSINDDYFIVKLFVFAIPVFACAYFYLANNMFAFYFLAVPTILLLLSVLSTGIFNISSNKREIIIFNLFSLIVGIFKLLFALFPHFLILSSIGFCVFSFVKIPVDIPYIDLIFNIIVGFLLFSIFFTSYLAFSQKLEIAKAYNMKIVSGSCVDVLISILFYIPQLLVLNCIIVGLAWYFFYVFKIPLNSPFFVYLCSIVLIFNISITAGYFAQVAYEVIKGEDEDYNDNYTMKVDMNFYGKNADKK